MIGTNGASAVVGITDTVIVTRVSSIHRLSEIKQLPIINISVC